MGERARILLVDDSKFATTQLAKALSEDYELVITNDGAEALRTLKTQRVALVIADMLMPQLSGLAFLGILGREYPHVATMVYTADIQASTVSKATELGAKAFVEKPATPEKIREAVRKILAEQAATPVTLDDPITTDAMREVFTIGVGRAAARLSELVYDTVGISVAGVRMLSRPQLVTHMYERFGSRIAFVRQPLSGTIEGAVYVVVSPQEGVTLVNTLLAHSDTSDEMTEADLEVFAETGQIVLEALIESLDGSLGLDCRGGAVTGKLGATAVLGTDLNLINAQAVAMADVQLDLPQRGATSELVVLVGVESLQVLLVAIKGRL